MLSGPERPRLLLTHGDVAGVGPEPCVHNFLERLVAGIGSPVPILQHRAADKDGCNRDRNQSKTVHEGPRFQREEVCSAFPRLLRFVRSSEYGNLYTCRTESDQNLEAAKAVH